MRDKEVQIRIKIVIGDSTIEVDEDMDLNRLELFKNTHPVLRDHIEGLVKIARLANEGSKK